MLQCTRLVGNRYLEITTKMLSYPYPYAVVWISSRLLGVITYERQVLVRITKITSWMYLIHFCLKCVLHVSRSSFLILAQFITE